MSDPIQELIFWQLRSQDLAKIKEKIQSFGAVVEDRFVDAFDEKYHSEERHNYLIEQKESCLNEDPRKNWLTNEEKFVSLNDE